MQKNRKAKIIGIIKENIKQKLQRIFNKFNFFCRRNFLGVFFINQTAENQIKEVHQYLGDFINQLKETPNINQMQILKTTIIDKIYLTIAIWFFGTTVIGIPIVFGIVAYRGFCLGYTISAIISCMGFTKGFTFIIITLLFQNIIFIPLLIALAVSGFKFYKSIIKDRRKENIKNIIHKAHYFFLYLY